MIDAKWFLVCVFIVVIVMKFIDWRKMNTKRRLPRRSKGRVGFIEVDLSLNGTSPLFRAIGAARARRQEQSGNLYRDYGQQIPTLNFIESGDVYKVKREFNYSDLEYSFGFGAFFQGMFSSDNLMDHDFDALSSYPYSGNYEDHNYHNDFSNSIDSIINDDLNYHHDSLNDNNLLKHHDLLHHHELNYHCDTGIESDWSSHNFFHHESDHYHDISTNNVWHSHESSQDSDWGHCT